VGPACARQHKQGGSQRRGVVLEVTNLQAAMRYRADGTVMAGVARLDRMIVDNLRHGSKHDQQEADHAPGASAPRP